MRCTSSVNTGSAMASGAPNGSSIGMFLGLCTWAPQIDARRRMPPDNCQSSFFSKPSRMRSRIPSVSRCHFKIRLALAKTGKSVVGDCSREH
jgi:hypothetical protein